MKFQIPGRSLPFLLYNTFSEEEEKSVFAKCLICVQLKLAALRQTSGTIFFLENLDKTPSNTRKILLNLIGFQMSLGSYKLL